MSDYNELISGGAPGGAAGAGGAPRPAGGPRAYRGAMKIRRGASDYALDALVYFVMIFVLIVMTYPFLYVLATSISDGTAVTRGEVTIIPIGFSTASYRAILTHKLLGSSYLNTILYSVTGTLSVLIVTSLTAYPLSLKKLQTSGMIAKLFVFTMFFSGGMIPTFLIVKAVGIMNTRLAIVLPAIISAWNVLVMRAFFRSIPDSLHESAYLDGANDLVVLMRIVLPLSKAVLATIGLFAFVGFWNDFFMALLYLSDINKYPLQMILRMILLASEMTRSDAESARELINMSTQGVKSAIIVVAIFPIMCLYPFVQKYFVKGIMIGSVKG